MIIESIQTCQQNENKNVEVIVVLGCVCLIGLIVHAGVVVQLLLLMLLLLLLFVTCQGLLCLLTTYNKKENNKVNYRYVHGVCKQINYLRPVTTASIDIKLGQYYLLASLYVKYRKRDVLDWCWLNYCYVNKGRHAYMLSLRSLIF